ncbi:LuxR C-terminal-related transcriptional regulator [Georgenia sp. SYP-B2076]|uniref:LuxR C-terminal-related transcriptional regulator n=1 Tax=Georgenia sp. SYP-B2076 TaxID=2495881 RepID=UPI00272A6A52|nr:LuxR C-terminal-related transcriptional regulator [Georgenia sp. SYP-B2076]
MPSPAQRAGNLPAEVTSFVGRRRELAEARKALATARLVSLVGPGGVGKTRLAVRIATGHGRGFRDGAWLVELAEIQEPALLGNAVMAALGLRDQAATEPAALLRDYLRDKELLLVLDNCEHLLGAAAELAGDVIRAAPGVRVVATSREPLSVPGEHVLPVPPLQLPSPDVDEPLPRLRQNEAVALFAERAAAASGRFEVTAANRAAVVDICRRLDGLPLAVELAAVRARVLTPGQIRDRLGARFDLLTGGGRAALPRHQTLRTTIDWSYDLLTPVERTLLTRLCVFAGRFTLDDVEAVCSADDLPAAGILDLLSSLLDKSLATREDVGGTACYRLHETMREYARLKLDEAGGWDAVERRCADYYLARCHQFAAEGRHRLLEWLAWMDLEIDNVRAVLRRHLDQGRLDRGLDLATSLVWYWVTRATTEGVRWMDEVLSREAGPHPWAYFVRGFLAVLQGDPAAATSALDRGVAAARAGGSPEVLAQSLAMASIAASMARDRTAATRLLDEARAVGAGRGDLGATLMTHQAQALGGFLDGDLAAVTSAATAGARLSRDAGDLYSLGMMLMNQGFVALMSGDLRESEERFTEGLRVAEQLDDRVAQCYLLGGLACCAAAGREPRLAAQLLGAMERLRSEAGATTNAGLAPALAHATSAASAALGPRFEPELSAGRRLSREDAVRLALREGPAAAARDHADAGVLGRRGTEVARLVADGLSNKEIGARLFISERTVESHVRNALNKLGFSSRAQIAGWMALSDG